MRVVSGMRTTGPLHLGHYHGVLKNWIKLQTQGHDCLFFAADWHALTTHYEKRPDLQRLARTMIISWIASGLDPNRATLFIQSHVPEHAELHLLLSMVTPVSWLERVPTYKDQQTKLSEKNLATYGFLGYPVLQTSDIALYNADQVPIGADQLPHLELAREIIRRFNHLMRPEPPLMVLRKRGKKALKEFLSELEHYQGHPTSAGKDRLRAWLKAGPFSPQEHKDLQDYCDQQILLTEPQALLTPHAKVPGLDGGKMSKSYNNTLALGESAEEITVKIKKMPTDPARVRRDDPGTPEKCPVWALHQIYSSEATRTTLATGCRNATIGCLECKQPLIDSIIKEQTPIRQRMTELENDPEIDYILKEGAARARDLAHTTLTKIRCALGLAHES